MNRFSLCLLAACSFVACGRQAAPESTEPPNVLVVLVDTLRADRLGAYGSARGLTPFLDRFAAGAYVFEHAYAQSSWTNPSVASLFTSRFQSEHRVLSFGSILAASESTLANALHGRGYRTAGFLANGLLGAQGFERGFDEFQALWGDPIDPSGKRLRKKRAETINALALDWLDRLPPDPRPRTFLYLHYVEPHTPYSPPAAILDRLLGGRPRPDLDALTDRMMFAAWDPPDADTSRDLELVYDAEVASIDAGLEALFGELERRGVLRDTLVVITSDHGEELGDHRGFGHGGTLYDELIRVPLIVRLPEQDAGERVGEVVSLVDVAPTLLDYADTARPAAFEGHSLREPMHRARSAWARLWRRAVPAPAFSELIVAQGHDDARLRPHEYAIVLGTAKLILGPKGEWEFFDLSTDPREQGGDGDRPAPPALRRALAEFVRRTDGGNASRAAAPIDPELQRRLRAFGYVN